jgi:hypothetical protein
MNNLERLLKLNPKLTLQVYADSEVMFVAGLYHADKGNHVASGYGRTLSIALDAVSDKAIKGGACKF